MEFKTKVKEPIADQIFVVLETSAETDIFDVMSIYNFKIKTELAVKINNQLGKHCKVTLFYLKYEE